MERLIYCPSDDKIEEAIKLSKNNSLQILVGDNFYTKDLIFDRNIVSVIKIPQKKTVNYIEYVTQHLHQNIEYINEYVEIKNKIKLFIDEIEVKPVYEEKKRTNSSPMPRWGSSPSTCWACSCRACCTAKISCVR